MSLHLAGPDLYPLNKTDHKYRAFLSSLNLSSKLSNLKGPQEPPRFTASWPEVQVACKVRAVLLWTVPSEWGLVLSPGGQHQNCVDQLLLEEQQKYRCYFFFLLCKCLIVKKILLVQFGSTASSFTHHCFCTISADANMMKKANNLSFIMEIVWPGRSPFISYVMLNRSDQSVKFCLVLFFVGHALRLARSQFPNQGLNPKHSAVKAPSVVLFLTWGGGGAFDISSFSVFAYVKYNKLFMFIIYLIACVQSLQL